MQYLYVKNWEKFQHYKDRSPAWIKLHASLLNNYDFNCLSDDGKLHLMLIWLLASQTDNKIPADAEYIAKKIGVTKNINFKELIDKGFLVDASNMLADCKQTASLEERRGEERRGNKHKNLEGLSVDDIADWLAEKRKAGKYVNHDPKHVLEVFKLYCQSNGKKYKDYRAAYMRAFDWDKCQPLQSKARAGAKTV